MKKREFIKTLGLAGFTIPWMASGMNTFELEMQHFPDSELPDEEFWKAMRNQYHLTTDYINLENGYYSVLPQSTLEMYLKAVKDLNEQGSYYMRTAMESEKQSIRQKMADFLQCPLDEIIITRNTTESLDTIISGIDWKTGDEAIMAIQDYGAMLDMFKQQASRYGMVNKFISIPIEPNSDEEIVALYKAAITSKTRLIMVSHMINITGQILPVRKICDMAHKQGVQVMVDGAHAIAHFGFKITDLDCDFYGASLHKWLSAPLGSGILYIKKQHIETIWPMFGESSYTSTDLRKLNHMGTGPVHAQQCIPYAIEFHSRIGTERKENRLRFLQNYWTTEIRGLKNIRLNTPADIKRSCAIANVGIVDMKPADMAKTLLEKYRIWTVAIDNANVQGCRITPHIYTNTTDLNALIKALKEMSGNA